MAALLAGALWSATAWCLLGLAWRAGKWLRTPAEPALALAPAPATRAGVVLRVAAELVLFRSLFRASPGTWALGWTFHVALLAVVLHHLWLFADPGSPIWGWAVRLYAGGKWWSGVLALTLLGLLARRVLSERIRYVSTPSDYLWLLYLGALAGTGMWLARASPTDLGAVRAFAAGLLVLEIRPLPRDLLLAAHVLLAAGLLALLPVSKLLHAPGVLFSPTLVQRAVRRGAGGRR